MDWVDGRVGKMLFKAFAMAMAHLFGARMVGHGENSNIADLGRHDRLELLRGGQDRLRCFGLFDLDFQVVDIHGEEYMRVYNELAGFCFVISLQQLTEMQMRVRCRKDPAGSASLGIALNRLHLLALPISETVSSL